MNIEEAKNLFRNDLDSYGKPKSVMNKINKIYKEFRNNDFIIGLIDRLVSLEDRDTDGFCTGNKKDCNNKTCASCHYEHVKSYRKRLLDQYDNAL